jgi:hypothetical protein
LFKAVEEIVFVIDNCGGKHIETMRTHPNSNVVEWSEDGRMMILRTGRLTEKFEDEIKSVVEAGSGWRPNVSVGMFTGHCVVQVLSSS